MNNQRFFKISKDYTETPGPRYEDEGSYSAQHFLRTKLLKLFKEVIDNKEILVIDLDDTAGYATSFLEGTFGGLAREFGTEKVLKHLEIISLRKPHYKHEVEQYVKDAKDD